MQNYPRGSTSKRDSFSTPKHTRRDWTRSRPRRKWRLGSAEPWRLVLRVQTSGRVAVQLRCPDKCHGNRPMTGSRHRYQRRKHPDDTMARIQTAVVLTDISPTTLRWRKVKAPISSPDAPASPVLRLSVSRSAARPTGEDRSVRRFPRNSHRSRCRAGPGLARSGSAETGCVRG